MIVSETPTATIGIRKLPVVPFGDHRAQAPEVMRPSFDLDPG